MKKGPNTTLRPGQGLGQPALNDPLQEAFQIDGKSRIVKITVNQGRLGSGDSVIRYYIAGATAAEAGVAGNPSNAIAPLPEGARDPSEFSGATALDIGHLALNTYEPSGPFDLKLTEFEYSATATCNNSPPPDGKKYAIATVTARFNMQERSISMFHVEGGNDNQWQVETTDGDRIKPQGFLKATKDESADHQFEQGDEYAFRVFFLLDKDATAKDIVIAATAGTKWEYAVPASS